MTLAMVSWDGLSRWARGNGLEIVMVVVGAILLARFASWFGHRITDRIDALDQRNVDSLVRSEQEKHRHALTQVVTWVTIVLIYTITAFLVLQKLQIPLTSLVAPATVAGVAVGFGAQRVVQDLLSGFFIITERQYGYGDVVRVSPPGTTVGVSGTVEEVTLRITRLRTVNGELLILPNGEIRQVTNLSRDWARAVIDVPIPIGTDINRVSNVLRTVGEEAFADEDLRPQLLDPPSVMGVEELDVEFLKMRVVARTLPGKQFDVGRILRARIALALQAEGLNVPPTFVDAPPSSAA
jgi:moderate conductance mechanosensitive channel